MKRNGITHSLYAALIASMAATATAEESLPQVYEPLVPSPSVGDITNGQDWLIGLGAGFKYGAEFNGGDVYESEVEPAGVLQWRNNNTLLFIEGSEMGRSDQLTREGYEVGLRSLVQDDWLVQLSVRNEEGREADDFEEAGIKGIEGHGDQWFGVLETRHALDPNWSTWIAARVMAGEDKGGNSVIASVGRRFADDLLTGGAEIIAFAAFSDSKSLNSDFGINTVEAAKSELPETSFDDDFRSAGLQLIARHELAYRFHLLAQAGVAYYNSKIQDSPLTSKKYQTEGGLAVYYHF